LHPPSTRNRKIDTKWQAARIAQEEKGENRQKTKNKKEGQNEEKRHTLNTISGGFAGGGESSSSRKKYLRQVMLWQEYDKQVAEHEPNISFTPKDYQDVVPHDVDPMVITLQIFKLDIKRVLIDPGSSVDILYYETFEKMGLDPKQLQPFRGTLAGFTGEQVHVHGYVTSSVKSSIQHG